VDGDPVLHLMKHNTEHMVTDLKDKQIEIIALMNSWVFSRLIAENERAGESLAREMDTVAEAEREQGMSPIPLISCRLPTAFLAHELFFQRLPHSIFLQASRLRTHVFFGTCSRSSH